MGERDAMQAQGAALVVPLPAKQGQGGSAHTSVSFGLLPC